MRKIAQKILKLSAKLAIARNNYKIVAITGSVGKTSTKKAIVLVLSKKYKVLSSEEGYNTEFGLPLILLEKKIPKNKVKWLFLIFISPLLALRKKDYNYAVLEMGADKPGDIEYLISITKPDISIVTNVSEAHMEEFKDIKNIAKEKGKILSKLDEDGIAVLNADNKYTSNMNVPSGARKVTFGRKSTNIKINDQDLNKTRSVNQIQVDGRDITIKSTAIGEHILYSFSSAIAVGVSQGISLEDAAKSLESFKPVKGRLNIISGIRGSVIIDDSYNANPTSMKNALDVLGKFKKGRKIAALGNMNELGEYSKEAHEEIGRYLPSKCDILVTVGDEAKKYMARSANESGMSKENIFSFDNSEEAGDFLKEEIKKDDVVLAKGSQNKVRMERVVKKIMMNQDDASKLLCRQSKEWERKD